MVTKRSMLAFAGTVLMLASLAPLALAQSPEPTPAPEAEVTTEASPVPMVEISQGQLDGILAQLAELIARVEVLEEALAALGEPATGPETEPEQAATKPKAPVAASETARRFTVNDPNPKRGLVTWKDRATDEDGYRIYARRVYCGLVDGADPSQALDYDDFTETRTKAVRVGRAPADATRFRPVHQDVRAALPPQPKPLYGSGEIYELLVSAFNEAGESKPVLVGTYITTPEFLCP